MRLIKDAGFDFVADRTTARPAVSAACDRLGLLLWSENCFWGTAPFKNSWAPAPIHRAGTSDRLRGKRESQLNRGVRIHRNHPSIIVWSMGNEEFFTAPSTMPKVRLFLKDLVAFSHQLDPARPAAIGGAQRGEIDKLGDLAGYNGDGATLFSILESPMW